jgi:hypothetical protein
MCGASRAYLLGQLVPPGELMPEHNAVASAEEGLVRLLAAADAAQQRIAQF